METSGQNIPGKAEGKPAENGREELQQLGPHIMSGFQRAADHRRESGMDDELMECLLQSKSEYSEAERAAIRAKGAPEIYIGHSALKGRTAYSLVSELFLNSSDPPFTMEPTPVPEVSDDDVEAIAKKTIQDFIDLRTMDLIEQGVPPEAVEAAILSEPPDPLVVKEYARSRRDELDNLRTEEASRKVARMLKKVRDQLCEGLFSEAMSDCIYNAAFFGTCVLKGPLRKSKKRVTFAGDACKLVDKEVLECVAISPFNCYPSKGAVKIEEGDFFERVKFTPKDFRSMGKMGEGYFKSEINEILSRYPNGGLKLTQPGDSERKRLENDGSADSSGDSMIEGIEFWGYVRGSMLLEIGIENTDEDVKIEEEDYYSVNAICVDNKVVFCTLTDEKFGRNLFKGVFYKTPGSWWGISPMKLMRDPAKMYNATARDLCVNNAHSSGPMLDILDSSRLRDGTSTSITPWEVRYWTNKMGSDAVPFKYTHTISNAPELQANADWTERLFDTITGIPAYSHGSDTAAGAGRTYNGLLLITQSSKQGINTVIFSLFLDVLKPFLTYLYRYNMIFDTDADIKGDCEVAAGGLLSIMMREQSLNRLKEFLQLMQNPAIAAIVGETGLAELLREYIKLLSGINPDKVVPSKQELERRKRAAEIEKMLAQAEQQGMERGLPSSARPGETPPVPTGMAPSPVRTPDMRPRMRELPQEEEVA